MTSPTDDAVAFFTNYVHQFDAHYHQCVEFQERLEIWRALLDAYWVPAGLSVDVGCGTGIFTFYLARKGGRVVGVDGARDMCRFCETQRISSGLDNVTFREARLPHFGMTDIAGADLVISSSVLEYVRELDTCLANLADILKPGGTLIVSLPNVWAINRAYERLKYAVTGTPEIYKHILHFTSPSGLTARVRPLGLTLIDVRYYTHRTRLARLTQSLGLPLAVTADLFVSVFRKS